MSSPRPLVPIADVAGEFRSRHLTLVKNEKKLRVLHVGKFYPPHPGGMESHLEALCGELKRAVDLEVVVASSDGPRTSEEVNEGVKVARLCKLFTLRSAPFCPQLARRIRASNADIVHIHHPNPPAIVAYLASGHRGRLVITYHSDVVRQRLLGRLFDPILQRALNRADAIIVSSANYISSSHVLPAHENKCRVVPFGIPLERWQQPDVSEVARLRQQFGPRIVLGVGRLVYYKGFEHLIAAMKFVEGHLIIVGRGPLHAALQQKAESAGVAKRVTFLTDVQDVGPYYFAADVFALPSIARSEAFGIVQLEAMACGKPIVNTNLDSGVTSVSIDGVTGITVPPANAKALSEAISYLLNRPLQREVYGRAGQLRVQRHFSLEAMVRKTLTVYQEVMNSPSQNGVAAKVTTPVAAESI